MTKYVHLLRSVTPKRYDLRLEVRTLGVDDSFDGSLKAELDLLTPMRTVELHAKCLQVRSASVQLPSGEKVLMTEAVVQDASETVLLTLP